MKLHRIRPCITPLVRSSRSPLIACRPTSNSSSTPSPSSKPTRRKQNSLPASYYRGGTSRAIFFNASHLPASRSEWPPIFRGALGSPDPHHARQLDGLGGGISSLSKICVVGAPSSRPDVADVDYTFAAVGVRDDEVDFSANCGNMTAAVGPYAVDSGLIDAAVGEGKDGETTVRILNTNTGKVIHATFPIVEGEACACGDFAIDGVAGSGARVSLSFIKPAGAKTGRLLPTGNARDVFEGVEATCIDVGNPSVFVRAGDFGVSGTITPQEMEAHPTLMTELEKIRQAAARAMGVVDEDTGRVPGSIPKIALVAPPAIDCAEADLRVSTISVGQPHKAVPITVALSVAAAAEVEGSLVKECVTTEKADPEGITIGHASGKLVVAATFAEEGECESATVFRTARRLMEGRVYWKDES